MRVFDQPPSPIRRGVRFLSVTTILYRNSGMIASLEMSLQIDRHFTEAVLWDERVVLPVRAVASVSCELPYRPRRHWKSARAPLVDKIGGPPFLAVHDAEDEHAACGCECIRLIVVIILEAPVKIETALKNLAGKQVLQPQSVIGKIVEDRLVGVRRA